MEKPSSSASAGYRFSIAHPIDIDRWAALAIIGACVALVAMIVVVIVATVASIRGPRVVTRTVWVETAPVFVEVASCSCACALRVNSECIARRCA